MRRKVLAALVFALVACGGDKTTGPQPVTGSYSLHTVNGGALPAVIYHSTVEQLVVTAGTLNLAADMTWTGTLGAEYTDFTTGQKQRNDAIPISGTYTLSGSSITLNDPADELVFTGTVANGKLTATADLIGLGTFTTLEYLK